MRVIHPLKMDLVCPWTGDLLHMVQGDSNTRVVELQLFSNGVTWEIPSADLVTVAFKKPDQTKGFYETDGSVDGNRIQVVLAPQVLTAYGKVTVVVELHRSNGESLASFPFGIMVDQNPGVNAIASEDYFDYVHPLITEAVKEANLAAAEAYAAAEKANSASEVAYRAERKVDTLREVVSKLHSNIVETASGDVIILNDASDLELAGLRIFGKTPQDGTPTPEAPVELVSVGDGGSVSVTVCGKNLFADGKVYSGGLDSSYGRINIGFPVESPVHGKGWAGVGIRVAVRPNNTYTVSSDITPCKYFTVTFYKEFDSVGSKENAISFKEFTNRNNATFTTPENCYCVVITSVSNVESDFTWSWWQLENGSVATTYEPYKGQTLTIPTPNGLPGIPVASGGNYTDASGQQWICDEVDFGRGVYVRRVYKQTFDGSESWVDGETSSGKVRPTCRLPKDIVKAPNPLTKAPSLCDCYQSLTADDTWFEKTGHSVSNASNSVQFYDSNFTTLNSWKAHLAENPVTVLVQLATPIETPLSAEELAQYAALHTNYPNTTIYNDGGAGMEVKYVADTKLYIDKKFAELATALVNNV